LAFIYLFIYYLENWLKRVIKAVGGFYLFIWGGGGGSLMDKFTPKQER
jgi:hypothetical protein